MARGDISTEFKNLLPVFGGPDMSKPIDVNAMAREVYLHIDTSEWSRQELELEHITGILSTFLNNMGYRSVIPGKGFYVDPSKTQPEYIINIVNTELDRFKREEKTLARLRSVIREKEKTMKGQFEFDWDAERYVQAMTLEELLQKLLNESAV